LVPTIAASRRKVEKGTLIDPNLVQLREESAQKLFAEAGPDSASKFEFLSFIKTHEQRAKIFPRSFRFRVPADDEFLLQMQLDFDPRSRAPSGLIPRTGALTDQAFQPKFASPVQKLWDVLCEGDRIPDHTRRLF